MGRTGAARYTIMQDDAARLSARLDALDPFALENWRASLGLTRIRAEFDTVLVEAQTAARIWQVVDPVRLAASIEFIEQEVARTCGLGVQVDGSAPGSGLSGIAGEAAGAAGSARGSMNADVEAPRVAMETRVWRFVMLLAAIGLTLSVGLTVRWARRLYFERRYGRRQCMIGARLQFSSQHFFGTIDLIGAQGARFVLSEGADLEMFADCAEDEPVTLVSEGIGVPSFIFNFEERTVRMIFEAEIPRAFQVEMLARSATKPFIADVPRPPGISNGPRHEDAQKETRSETWLLEFDHRVSAH